jgi:cytochrome bd-type quinol oxidase subunit 2
MILFLLVTVAFSLFPNFMVDVAGKANVTAFNSMTVVKNLQLGLVWFGLGFLLLLGYVVYMYKSFWGKVPEDNQRGVY